MKTIPSRQIVAMVAFLLLALSSTLHAQRIDTIKANPDAQPLRKIWQVTGGEFGGGKVGDGFGSVGDINQDGYEDWAVHYGTAREWRIFYGSDEPLSTTPVVILDSISTLGNPPVVGDFWGTGHKAVGFTTAHTRIINGTTFFFFELRIFRTDSNRLDTIPALILDVDKMNPPSAIAISNVQLQAADLDGDGADELIMFTRGVGWGSHIGGIYPDALIYRGGPQFRVDTPTIVLHDSEKNAGNNSPLSLTIAHADNDGRLDLITGSDYADGISKVKFYFGRDGSPWNWSEPDRVVPMSGFIPLDCDGDGMLDITVGGVDYRVSQFLSSSGKDIRTRSFTSDDIDRTYRSPFYYCYPYRAGYLNDSGKHYEMLDILIEGSNEFFGGGIGGGDGHFDAFSGDEATAFIRPAGDINGDGWDDLLGRWPDVNFDAGVAAVFAGGPYIPTDPSLGVRAITGEGHTAAISIWPNPATTELHIAWRGDLKQMPRGYRIHDMNGRLVAEGETPSWHGEMLWQCRDVAAGSYVLSIYDWQWQLLATTTITKV